MNIFDGGRLWSHNKDVAVLVEKDAVDLIGWVKGRGTIERGASMWLGKEVIEKDEVVYKERRQEEAKEQGG
jgi:hypothetical protein